MSWDYADLSHIAKEFGGPERFVNAVNYDGVVQGRWQVIISELVVSGIVGIGIGAKYLHSKNQSRKTIANVASQDQDRATNAIEIAETTTEIIEEPSLKETKKADKIVDRVRKRFKK